MIVKIVDYNFFTVDFRVVVVPEMGVIHGLDYAGDSFFKLLDSVFDIKFESLLFSCHIFLDIFHTLMNSLIDFFIDFKQFLFVLARDVIFFLIDLETVD